jgi:predicted  nucleic acid-binding Zn-ribbon protein
MSGSQVRCNGCREWFDKVYHECPECGQVRPAFNKWLYTAKMNNQLYDQARVADKERRFEQSLRSG